MNTRVTLAANLSFKPVSDRQETSLEIHGVVFGDNGAAVEQGNFEIVK